MKVKKSWFKNSFNPDSINKLRINLGKLEGCFELDSTC